MLYDTVAGVTFKSQRSLFTTKGQQTLFNSVLEKKKKQQLAISCLLIHCQSPPLIGSQVNVGFVVTTGKISRLIQGSVSSDN